MKNTRLILIVILTFTSIVNGQENDTYNYEIELGHDNDFFLLVVESDRYYTYGINGSFKWKSKREHFYFSRFENYQNHYSSIRSNIKAYTPDYLPDGSIDLSEERSYAGWSYVNYNQTVAFSESFLRLGIDVGILSPDSKAGEMQNWFHRLIDDVELQGWENQLPNQFGFNLRGNYSMGLFDWKNIDIYGTLVEYFFDLGLGIKTSAYNATLQGNIFESNDLFSQNDINNFIFKLKNDLRIT